MKREDIQNAAKKEAENLACLVYYGGSAISQEDVENACVKIAEWRINSVWHDVKERPDENEPTIIEKNNGKTFFAEKGYKGPWKYNVEQFGFKRWAYIKDLIPNTEK